MKKQQWKVFKQSYIVCKLVVGTEVAEQKYDWGGAGVRSYEAADYPGEASACEGQE